MQSKLNTKGNGGKFRSPISLSDAQEVLSRRACGLPAVRTLDTKSNKPARRGFDKARSMAELDAIMGGR